MLIIGIDPGISGSICFFEDGKITDVVEMPSMAEGKKNKKQVNAAQIYNEINTRIKNFEKKKILKIGLAFSVQKINNVPVTKYDKKLDYIVTDKYTL